MVEITASIVKELRDRTGVSMMECKKALVESNGDIEVAIEELRKRGIAKAAKKGDRVATEGTVQAVIEGGRGALVQLFCETDFVARNDEFPAIAKSIAKIALEKGIEDAKTEGDAIVKEAVLKLGENIQLGEISILEGEVVESYIHSNAMFGALVAGSGVSAEALHDIAMHISISDPECVSPDEVSDELVAKEKEIWAAQLKEEGKPEAMIENIMKGKEGKFRSEKALLTQDFVKDPSQKIQDVLGGGSVTGFVRFAI